MRQNGVSLAFGRAFWLRAWLVLLLVCAPSCGFHSDVAGLERLRSNIRERVGTDAAITVQTSQGKSTVTVRLARLPAGDPVQVQALVEALAKAEFPKTSYVVVESTND